MHTVPVHIPGGSSYDIVVRPGLLETAGLILRSRSGSKKVCVVSDTTVAPLHLDPLLASLKKAEFEPIVAIISTGEEQKNVETVAKIYDALIPARIDRNTPLIALGGGIVGDTAGFAAATILRGIPLIQMPTTLLSMVDSSVGGKTGVNHSVGKNLIGSFIQPAAVLIDPQTLKTLPARELRSGLAECIKHEIIRDADGFGKLENNIHRAIALDVDYLAELIAHNVAIKARVVEIDPFEKGDRAHLNFGHTFGHAIENASNYSYTHGESISLGMAAACFTAENLRLINEATRRRIVTLLEKAGLPTHGLTTDVDQVVQTMGFDKKVQSGKLRFVLPDRLGHVIIRDDVPPDLVRAAVRSLKG